MSTTDSIVSSRAKQSSWRKSDTTWTLGLLVPPSAPGCCSSLSAPGLAGLSHSADAGFSLSHCVLLSPGAGASVFIGSNPSGNITETVEEHFGKTGGVVITFLYFFAICPLLWIYGVTITNTFMTFWENQLQMPALNRGFVALFLLLLMAFVIWFGKDLMVKVMSYPVWPFIASPVLISLSLIPYWNSAVIDQVDLSNIALTGHDGILVTVWLGISIMVFSFNFSPIVSSFVVSKREEYEKEFGREFTERKCSQIISRASMLMVAVVMFFAFSCLFTLSPQNMADAKAQNIPVLSYRPTISPLCRGQNLLLQRCWSMARLSSRWLLFSNLSSVTTGDAGRAERPVLKFGYKGDKTKVSMGKLNTISMIFIMGSTGRSLRKPEHSGPD